MIDDIIRDLAKTHGHAELSDSDVLGVKRKISNVYIDRVLDGSTPEVTTEPVTPVVES